MFRFDADIAAAIATKFSAAYDLTITAVMQTNDWDPIIPDLQSGKFDAILSAMTKTAERDQVIDFTRAYYTSSQGILANADSPSITGIADPTFVSYRNETLFFIVSFLSFS